MANVKVEVQEAIVDGKGKGATLEIDEASAKQLEAIGYVKTVKAEPSKPTQKAAPKTTAKTTSKAKPKASDTDSK